MCVIFALAPGVMPDFDKFQNAVWNNPHGFGLVLRDPTVKRLQLIKSTEEQLKAGNDPEHLYKLIKDNKDIERYLHVRWCTAGAISLDNVQPFPAFMSDKRQVYFMHNGTLHDYTNKTGYVHYQHGVKQENKDDGDSDTKRFNEQFLSPFLNRFKGEAGMGDTLDPVAQLTIAKFWGPSAHNRGLLISSDQGPSLINSSNWEKVKNADGTEFMASNNTYFNTLSRGYEYDRRKKEDEERQKKEAEERRAAYASQSSYSSTSSAVVPLKDVDLTPKTLKKDDVKDLLNGINIWEPDGLYELRNMTALELLTFVNSVKDDVVTQLLVHLTYEFAVLYDRHQSLVNHVKAKNESSNNAVRQAA